MAGLTKHPRSPYWTAIFYNGAGVKDRRSTKQTDRRKALKTAMEWEDLANAGREKRLVEAQARKVVSDILERATGERLHFYSAREWFNQWLTGKKDSTSEANHARRKQVVEAFLEHVGERADLTIAAIGAKDARGFRDDLKKTRSPETVNQILRKHIAPAFEDAKRMGYITVNPCDLFSPLADVGKASRDVFAAEQITKLLTAADDDWKGLILLAYFTGLRLGDLTALTWQQVDVETQLLTAKPGKTRSKGTVVAVPLHPQVMAWLRTRPAGVGRATLFPSMAGRRSGGKEGLSGEFARIMAKAGVVGRVLRASSSGRKLNSLSFHSLRHSFVSALANAGVAPDVRKKLSGHSSDSSHAIYTHHELTTLRDAMAKVPSVG